MRVFIKNRSDFYTKNQVSELETILNQLLLNEEPDIIVPIEIRNKPSIFSRIRRFLVKRTLSFPDGEVTLFPRRVILYKRAFEGDFERLIHILLHEINHYLDFDYDDQSEREKRADQFAERFGYGHHRSK